MLNEPFSARDTERRSLTSPFMRSTWRSIAARFRSSDSISSSVPCAFALRIRERTSPRRGGPLEVSPLAGLGPGHEELTLAFLTLECSIQRVSAGPDRLAGHEILHVDGGAELGECLEIAQAEYFPRPGIRLEAPV